MNGEKDDIKEPLDNEALDDETSDDGSSDDALTSTIVMTEDGADDSVGDTTIEMDIEKLVAKLDASDSEDVHRKAEMRRKLEELREQRERELDSTFNFNLDEE
ncbi:MAG: hypothetical protein ACR2RD_03325 [Woeseiaceae bacterium]